MTFYTPTGIYGMGKRVEPISGDEIMISSEDEPYLIADVTIPRGDPPFPHNLSRIELEPEEDMIESGFVNFRRDEYFIDMLCDFIGRGK